MKQMNIHQDIQALRLQLLDMSRVSQRIVDYSIKSYQLGRLDFCAQMRFAADEISVLRCEITEISDGLLSAELPGGPDARFVLSAVRICDALHAVYTQAVEVAANSKRLLANRRLPVCAGLTSMGEVVNCLMRLCIIALFDEEVLHADTVLRSREIDHLSVSIVDRYTKVHHRLRAQADYEFAIATGLTQMVKEIYVIANAVVFWLEGTDRDWFSDASRERGTIRAVPARGIQGIASRPSPYWSGMLDIV